MERIHYWDWNGRERWVVRLTEAEMRRREEARRNRKETPREMIRSLQGVFCGGRYRSWASLAGRTGA